MLVGSQFQRVTRSPALGADSNQKQESLRAKVSHLLDGAWMRHTQYKTHGTVARLLQCLVGQSQVERFAVHLQILQLGRARVRGATEDKHAFAGPFKKRREAIPTQIGVDGDRIETNLSKNRLGLETVGIGDIGTLGISDHRNTVRNFRSYPGERFPAGRTERLKEGKIDLVCGHEFRR